MTVLRWLLLLLLATTSMRAWADASTAPTAPTYTLTFVHGGGSCEVTRQYRGSLGEICAGVDADRRAAYSRCGYGSVPGSILASSTSQVCIYSGNNNTYATPTPDSALGCDPGKTYNATNNSCDPAPADSDKDLGKDCSDQGSEPNSCGNPVNVATGNKFQAEVDLTTSGFLGFTRYYNSTLSVPSHLLGPQWTHTYSRSVSLGVQSGVRVASVQRPDGKRIAFHLDEDDWLSDPDQVATLQQLFDGSGATIGWYFSGADPRERETYDARGRLVELSNTNGEYATLEYNSGVIEGNQDDYLLTQVTSNQGRTLVFTYDTSRRLHTLTDAAGAVFTYSYDSAGRLATVEYPGSVTRSYVYNESSHTAATNLPYALTGIVDENGDRYATFGYQADGKAVLTEHAGNVSRFAVTFNTDGSSSITLPSGASQSRQFQSVYGVRRPTQVSTTDGTTTRARSFTYDSYGRTDVATDATGVTTDYNFSSRGLLTQRIDAANTTTYRRTLQTDWHASFPLPTEQRTYDSHADLPGGLVARIKSVYNSRGQLTARCGIDPSVSGAMSYACGSDTNAPTGVRQTRMTYCEAGDVSSGSCPRVGLLITIDGPRTDVSDLTTYTYYQTVHSSCASAPTTCPYRAGDLWKVTNALAQVTQILAYDGMGRVLSTSDANGVVTDLEYSGRGWLTAKKVRGTNASSEVDDAITRLAYDDIGQVTQLTMPNGAVSTFSYDAAHRLTGIGDAEGNTIGYTLDNAGQRVQEDTRDAGSALKRTLSRIYNDLGDLTATLNAASDATTYGYNARGEATSITDGLGRVTSRTLDPLHRLQQLVENTAGGTSDRAQSSFAHDALDRLTAITDPKGLDTTYQYDGLGNLIELDSPDTGQAGHVYDAAGNRTGTTDARSVTTAYGHDALNRLTSLVTPDSAQSVLWTYDSPQSDCQSGETFGLGRLAKIEDESGSTRYCYDRRGNMVRKVQTVTGGNTFTVAPTYNAADQLVALTYPSGAIVAYHRDDNGRIDRVDAVPVASGTQVTLVSSATYLPFGPLNTLTFGNGRVLTKQYDQDYAIASVADSASTNPLSLTYTLDDVGNVTGLTEQTGPSTSATRTIGYDGLNRVTQVLNGSTTVQTYSYNATGDRTSKTVGTTTQSYTYASTSHRLTNDGASARSYDANGNTTAIGTPAFVYDQRNRLRDHKTNGTTVTRTYRYNGKGERVSKTVAPNHVDNRYYVYDEAGHLLGEYLADGTRVQEYVWLDDTLVAVLDTFDGKDYQYVETDQLGTPRAVIHPTKNAIEWRWDVNPTTFGEHAPDGNPDGDSLSYELNLRYPGQHFDAESGLNYNYFRDYDSATGRYVESDPIGLKGGIDTYQYVDANPLKYFDPYGLARPTPGTIRNVPCNSEESERCQNYCAASGRRMQSCKRVEKWKITRATQTNGGPFLESFGWVKINESCSCEDDGFCKRNPGTCATGVIGVVIVGLCLAPEVTIPALAIP